MNIKNLKIENDSSVEYKTSIGKTDWQPTHDIVDRTESEQRSHRVPRCRSYYFNEYKNKKFIFFYFKKGFDLQDNPLYFFTENPSNTRAYNKNHNRKHHPYVFGDNINGIATIKSHRTYINVVSHFTKLYILYNKEDNNPGVIHEENLYNFYYLNEVNGEKVAYEIYNTIIYDGRTCEVLYQLTKNEIASLNIKQSNSAFVLKTKLYYKNLYLILSYNISTNISVIPSIDDMDFTNKILNLKNLIIDDSPLYLFNYFNVSSYRYTDILLYSPLPHRLKFLYNNFQISNAYLQYVQESKENVFNFKFLQNYDDLHAKYDGSVVVTNNTLLQTAHCVPVYGTTPNTSELFRKAEITFLYETNILENKSNYNYLKTVELMAWRNLLSKRDTGHAASIDTMWNGPLRRVQLLWVPTFPKPTESHIKDILTYFTRIEFPEVIELITLRLGFKSFNDRISRSWQYTQPNNSNISDSNIDDIIKIITDKHTELQPEREIIEDRLKNCMDVIYERYYNNFNKTGDQHKDSFVIDQCFGLSSLVFNHINIFRDILANFETSYIIDYYSYIFKDLHFSTGGRKYSYSNPLPNIIKNNLKADNNNNIYANEIIYTLDPIEKSMFNELLTDLHEVNLCKVKNYNIFNIATKFDVKNISVFDDNKPYYFPFYFYIPKLNTLPNDDHILFSRTERNFSYNDLLLGSRYLKSEIDILIDKFKSRANLNRTRYDVTQYLNEIYKHKFYSLEKFIENIIYVSSESIELPDKINLFPTNTRGYYDEYIENNPENNYTKILKYCSNFYFILYIRLLSYLYIDTHISNDTIENNVLNIKDLLNNDQNLDSFMNDNNDDHIFKTFLTNYCYYFYIDVKFNKDVVYSELYNYMLQLNNMINVLNISTTHNILDLNIYKTILNTIKTVIKKIKVDNDKIEYNSETAVKLSDIMISKEHNISSATIEYRWILWTPMLKYVYKVYNLSHLNQNSFVSIKLYNNILDEVSIIYLALNQQNELCIYDKIIRYYDNNCILSISKLNASTTKNEVGFYSYVIANNRIVIVFKVLNLYDVTVTESNFRCYYNLFEINTDTDTYNPPQERKTLLEIQNIGYQNITKSILEPYNSFTLETRFTKTGISSLSKNPVIATLNFTMDTISSDANSTQFAIKTSEDLWVGYNKTSIGNINNRNILIHYTYTYGTFKIYIDGELTITIPITIHAKLTQISDNKLEINKNGSNIFDINYVKLYNYVLSENEIEDVAKSVQAEKDAEEAEAAVVAEAAEKKAIKTAGENAERARKAAERFAAALDSGRINKETIELKNQAGRQRVLAARHTGVAADQITKAISQPLQILEFMKRAAEEAETSAAKVEEHVTYAEQLADELTAGMLRPLDIARAKEAEAKAAESVEEAEAAAEAAEQAAVTQEQIAVQLVTSLYDGPLGEAVLQAISETSETFNAVLRLFSLKNRGESSDYFDYYANT